MATVVSIVHETHKRRKVLGLQAREGGRQARIVKDSSGYYVAVHRTQSKTDWQLVIMTSPLPSRRIAENVCLARFNQTAPVRTCQVEDFAGPEVDPETADSLSLVSGKA